MFRYYPDGPPLENKWRKILYTQEDWVLERKCRDYGAEDRHDEKIDDTVSTENTVSKE